MKYIVLILSITLLLKWWTYFIEKYLYPSFERFIKILIERIYGDFN